MTKIEIFVTVSEFLLFLGWCILSYKYYKKHSFELALIALVVALLFLGIAILNFNF